MSLRLNLKKLITALMAAPAVAAVMGLLFVSAAHAQLEVTEIMYTPLNENAWEWIEVRNTGDSDVDLDGWLSFNLNQPEVTAPNPTILSNPNSPNTVIPAGGVAVIYDGFHGGTSPATFDDSFFRDAWNLDASAPLLAASFWPDLSNSEGSDSQSIAFWANETDYQADLAPVEDPEDPGTFITRVVQFTNAQFSVNYSDAAYPGPVDGSSMTWTGQGDRNDGGSWVVSQNGVAGGVTSTEVTIGLPQNNVNDVANPGLVTNNGTFATSGLHITEIMYNPASNEPDWEWVEVFNSSAAAIDLTGWVMDDSNGNSHAAANIAAGMVPAGEAAILYNGDSVTDADFRTAWESIDPNTMLNLVAVSNWTTTTMALNNTNDVIALWSDFASYDGDHQAHANAVVNQMYTDQPDFPADNGSSSITLNDRSADPDDGLSWDLSFVGDLIDGTNGSDNADPVGESSVFHDGGDIGSPGTFIVQTGPTADQDGDLDVDGADFLAIQANNAAGIGDWEAQFGTGILASASAGAVPEPATVSLLALSALALAGCRRRG